MKTQFLIPGSLYPTMTPQEEQQVAQQFVEHYKLAIGDPFSDDEYDQRSIAPLDLLAMAKHLENIGKLAYEMLLNDALREVKKMIDHNTMDDKGEIITANKQFVWHENKWLYNLLYKYNQLGNQRLSDGSFDPNSQTYHSLEVQQEQMKKDSKALTAQMAGLKERILNDPPQLKPTDIVVSLALKGINS